MRQFYTIGEGEKRVGGEHRAFGAVALNPVFSVMTRAIASAVVFDES